MDGVLGTGLSLLEESDLVWFTLLPLLLHHLKNEADNVEWAPKYPVMQTSLGSGVRAAVH